MRSGARVHLVKDYERFLRQERNIEAEKAAGYDEVHQHPKCSPDLNAIEGWWRLLKMHLQDAMPTGPESRAAFLCRLRRTVHWLNANRRAEGRRLCRNQKVRAREVIKLQGARCKW